MRSVHCILLFTTFLCTILNAISSGKVLVTAGHPYLKPTHKQEMPLLISIAFLTNFLLYWHLNVSCKSRSCNSTYRHTPHLNGPHQPSESMDCIHGIKVFVTAASHRTTFMHHGQSIAPWSNVTSSTAHGLTWAPSLSHGLTWPKLLPHGQSWPKKLRVTVIYYF